MKVKVRFAGLFVILFLVANSLSAQEPYAPKVLTDKDYKQAEKYMNRNWSSLVYGAGVQPKWIDDNQFTYRTNTPDGLVTYLVDAKKKSKKVSVAETPAAPRSMDRYRSMGVLSPDGKKEAFIRDYNLWVKEVETKAETQLTKDGVEDFGYATDNAGWTRSDRPVMLWSPDSKKIATFQHDARGVGMMYMVSTNVGHPKLEAWKYPLPEDTVIFRVERVVIHLDGPKVVRLKMGPDQHRGTITDHIADGGVLGDAEWSEDGSKLAFVSVSRDHKDVALRVADPMTGDVRTVLKETETTFFESGFDMINWHMLAKSNEAIWFSQRSDWGHLYLYDLGTGALKNQVTTGDWRVLQLLHIDREGRKLLFTGSCREPGDPYFTYLYCVNFDGSDLKLLTPDSANHSVSFSPGYDYFVDTWSTPVTPPVSQLRDMKGKKLLDLEKADISKLTAAEWKAPIPITMKARDGVTDIYGLMYTPSFLDVNKKYPIINSIYPGPQSGSTGSRSFASVRGDQQAMAELGFIVVTIDAMGTPGRSKSFHEAYYGNMGDNGLPDHITGMKQLAARFKWIDIDRVGIFGHSGGGFASTDAILRYPDFFKVAVSGSGNHDNRNYEDDWGEKWQGLLTKNPDGTTSYDNQANQLLAKNLKGKLLITHGTMDGNVPLSNTMLVVQALIAANKDFDLILFPNAGHGYGSASSYMMRKRWNYFVKNLLGADTPKEFEFGK
ncbi:MAG: DPP IV N-terminal domain-containing protein [Bacteroidales bacterium]|jgi:dipeptidyl aminopeptidase/acylaminoacyl peptidase